VQKISRFIILDIQKSAINKLFHLRCYIAWCIIYRIYFHFIIILI